MLTFTEAVWLLIGCWFVAGAGVGVLIGRISKGAER